eukprot:87558-Heterocapsa_arctica.AAC.2
MGMPHADDLVALVCCVARDLAVGALHVPGATMNILGWQTTLGQLGHEVLHQGENHVVGSAVNALRQRDGTVVTRLLAVVDDAPVAMLLDSKPL